MQALLARFDAFCANARERLVRGHAHYGDEWRKRDNLAELAEECEDAFVYGFFDWLRAGAASANRR